MVLVIFIIVFFGGTVAMAHGSGQMAPSTANLNGNNRSGNSMAGMDMRGKDQNMNMNGYKQNDNMAGMDMEGKTIRETPPNAKVLGTYGAVNASFIVFGIWNKWFRRKDDTNGHSK
ncbi:hypothetical protein HPT25_03065 [Bacillus sp. BRMEA1]|uniref:hypothetical protein n=1 Tax=Neobacillus endophyticus TaxID=2738405 RepID=UPI0015649642|nr:hypothetical protein [Neobacillus endophyticus]NRD76470.1 hypothetical protein [Neobacillus endophyticus]